MKSLTVNNKITIDASGQNYYDASLDFAQTGLEKIKKLAEQR